MFDFFRKYNKFMMVLLFLLIIPSFVLFGVERYTQDGGKGEKVAHVDGQDITRPEWDAQHRSEVDRIRQRAPNIDAAMLDSDAARYATLERMVRDRVLLAAAAKEKLSVTDEHLARLFASDPALVNFRDANGKFDAQLFARATGQSPQQYEAAVRGALVTQQVLSGVADSAFATPAETAATLDAFHAQREIQVARFDPTVFAAKVNVSDADLDTYYKAHVAQFQAPEQADIQYLVLDLDAAKKRVVLNDADVKTYYEQNQARYGTKEERRAGHILIAAAADAPAADKAKAKAKAEELLAELKKNPSAFADLARKNSQDPGSAEKGGDLDFVTRGAMVKPFEDALFALKKGEISNVVETEFGYHIIRLEDIKPAVVQPFDQVRTAIEGELRSQQAVQECAKAAEEFSDIVYQQADSLQPAADKLKLQVQTAQGVLRQPPADAKGVLTNRNFVAALFAPDSIERKHNTEAVEVGTNELAAGRVVKYAPARTQPLEEVKDKVRAELIAERAAELARKEGEAKLAAWKADAKGASLAAPVTVSRQATQSLPPPVVAAALRADTAQLPAWMGVDLGAQGYAVVKVNKAVPRDPPAAEMAKAESSQLAQAVAGAEQTAYYELLKQRYKAGITVARPQEIGLAPQR